MKPKKDWYAFYTQYAIDFILNNVTSERVAKKLFSYRELLEGVPDLGRPYDPIYPAARSPFPCRELLIPDTPFVVFYLKDEDKKRITIFCIEYQRCDPNARFSAIDYTLMDW